MKITPKIYAQVMLEGTHGKNNSQVIDFVKKIVNVLAKNHALSQEKNIINYFSKIWNDESSIVEASVSTAKKIDEKSLAMVKKHIKDDTGAKEIVISEKIDKSIIGGVILEYDNKVFDNSLRTKINNLKRVMIK